MNKGTRAIIIMVNAVAIRVIHDFQTVLGGYLEALPVGDGFTVFIDEDGKAKGLPENPLATDVVKRMLAKVNRTLLPGDCIVGPAIFVGIDENGDTCDLPEEVEREYFR